MILTTERLILRAWEDSDAADLYHYAKDDRIGPIAGWPVHESEQQSLNYIQTIFAHPYVFAVALKHDNRVIGMVGLMVGQDSHFDIAENEAEIAYWLGVPFWGQGIIPEAVQAVIRYAFEDLNLNALWCGYFEHNHQSHQVQTKCGFKYHHTERNTYHPLLGDYRTQHVSYLSRRNKIES